MEVLLERLRALFLLDIALFLSVSPLYSYLQGERSCISTPLIVTNNVCVSGERRLVLDIIHRPRTHRFRLAWLVNPRVFSLCPRTGTQGLMLVWQALALKK